MTACPWLPVAACGARAATTAGGLVAGVASEGHAEFVTAGDRARG